MKQFSLALVAAAALATTSGAQAADMTPVYKAAPVQAEPQVSGFLGLYVGGDSYRDGLGHRETVFVYGGEARLNYWLSSVTSFQVDVEAEGTARYKNARGGSNADDGRIAATFGGHWSYRNSSYLPKARSI